MSVSSGTASLFASVVMAIGAASAGAWALKHPVEFYGVAKRFLPAEWLAAPTGPAQTPLRETQVDPRQSRPGYADVTLRAGSNGHFETDADINGRSIDVMVDTGATIVALTHEDAERAGIFLRPSDFTHQVATANGIAKIAPITIDSITIGSITVHQVQGAVSERGKLHQTLLGMSFLGRLSRVDMRANTLELHQ